MTVSSCPRHPSHIVIVAVALALTTYSATPALAYAFAPSSLTAPTNPVSSNTAKRVGVGRAAGTQEEKPLSVPAHSQRRRAGLISRKARVRPRGTAAAPAKSAGTTQQQRVNLERVGGVGDLVRIEVAQRLKEIKLMTQPEGAPLATAEATLVDPEALGNTSALERQISLLSTRIKSIAKHLQVTPTDAVSRKGLVALVKRRRFLLEALRHRDNARWLATTEKLGLRQRPDGSSAAATAAGNDLSAARRARRRDRGKAKRDDSR